MLIGRLVAYVTSFTLQTLQKTATHSELNANVCLWRVMSDQLPVGQYYLQEMSTYFSATFSRVVMNPHECVNLT